ncbi:tetratricopeptide repeat protein [Variovorax guangxiensis]|uniref:tetratricopeptide repeat protein n=1 Tax=Variovorax guangxiensis TaxID=1775474 RepID=UPI002854E392|nr:tetratricopeptide repeat protein [Variovorax guangxiensis]MDR6853757.1 putative TPR repeat methyltransferase [Variovorax guangxiensis]
MRHKKTLAPGAEEATAPRERRFTIEQAFEIAQTVHRDGRAAEAEGIYRAVLQARPEHVAALGALGVARHQQGDSGEALQLIRRALALAPGEPGIWNNLGNVLLEAGQVDAAADAYEQAVRLAPDLVEVHNNLGVLRRAQQRPVEAEAAYRRAIALNPRFADALSNLGRLLNALERTDEALVVLCEAVLLQPDHIKARHALGMTYCMAGRVPEAAQVYRDWLAEEPDNPEARHHLAACSGDAVPERAADAYVEKVFDGFAESFESKLAHLHYRAPQLIEAAVAERLGAPQRALAVLDAGCGTGLCGPLLAPYAQRLEGVDLSQGMLAKAEHRQVYDALAKAELMAFLRDAAPARYDLIVSADTLCYFGELQGVCDAAARALRPQGWLFFTVEALLGDGAGGFQLHPHGRYSHREAYLREVLAAAGLAVEGLERAQLRMESGKPVEGWVVSCRKEASSDGAEPVGLPGHSLSSR